MSNILLESLWARVDTNIGARIKQISELLTQALSANTESVAARDSAATSASEASASESNAATSASNAASSEAVAKSAETAASGYAETAQISATEAVDAKNRAVEIAGGDFATLQNVDDAVAAAFRVDTEVGTRIFLGDMMIYGDTGTRVLTQWDSEGVVTYGEIPEGLEPTPGVRGGIFYRRLGEDVILSFIGANATTVTPHVPIPKGFAPNAEPFPMVTLNPVRNNKYISAKIGRDYAYLTGAVPGDRIADSGSSYAATMTWKAARSWPTTLPGIPR